MKSIARIVLLVFGSALPSLLMAFEPIVFAGEAPTISLEILGTYRGNTYNSGSSIEPAAYDPRTRRLFIVSIDRGGVDIVDIQDPSAPKKLGQIDVLWVGLPSTVAFQRGVLAIGIQNVVKTEPGYVVFYDADGNLLADPVQVGVQPEAISFAPNGRKVVAVSAGEANDAYTVDPPGSVSVIEMARKGRQLTPSVVTDDFSSFNNQRDQLLASGVRLFGPNDPTVSQDLEPEAVVVSQDSGEAWVTMPSNNALAVVDLRAAKVVRILPFGYKDHNVAGNGLDASDKDGSINIRPWPVRGIYQPDLFASYRRDGRAYLVTPNEGNPRDSDGFSERERVKNLVLDSTAFPDSAQLQQDENLGRLRVATVQGDTDGDGDFDELYSFGGRSFAIWTPDLELIFDSGDDFEQITAAAIPGNFNSQDNESSFDDRSDQRGPEPEALTVGRIGPRDYVFVVLEQIGGIMIYDISNPHAPTFEMYVNNRNFAVDPKDVCVDGEPPSEECAAAGDLGPEGVTFIPAAHSPIRADLVVVAHEISDTTTIFRLEPIHALH